MWMVLLSAAGGRRGGPGAESCGAESHLCCDLSVYKKLLLEVESMIGMIPRGWVTCLCVRGVEGKEHSGWSVRYRNHYTVFLC